MGDIKCGAAKCPNRNQLTATLLCSGICKNYFHMKCIGLNSSLLDKINNVNLGLYWYCEPCRKLSLSTLSLKIEKIGQVIGDLGAKFSDLSSTFKSVESNFTYIQQFHASITPVVDVVENHTQTDSLDSSQPPVAVVDIVENHTQTDLLDFPQLPVTTNTPNNMPPVTPSVTSPVPLNAGRKRRRQRNTDQLSNSELPPLKRHLSNVSDRAR